MPPSFHATSPSLRTLLPATLLSTCLATLACVSACGGGDDEGGDGNTQGGSAMSEGGSGNGGSSSPQGGKAQSGTGGKAEAGSAPVEGGTSAMMGEAGMSSMNPRGGGLTGNGIVGTFNGMVHLHTFPAHIPQQTDTVVITASSAMYPLYDVWTVRFLPKLGKQDCTGDVDVTDTFITFGSQTNFALGGTTAGGGSCSINVTSITPNFEGTFTAKLIMEGGPVEVTDGAFSVPN